MRARPALVGVFVGALCLLLSAPLALAQEGGASATDIRRLEQAIEEVRQDLVNYFNQTLALEGRVERDESQRRALDNQMNDVLTVLRQLSTDADRLRRTIDEVERAQKDLLELGLDSVRDELEAVRGDVSAGLAQTGGVLSQQVGAVESRLNEIEGELFRQLSLLEEAREQITREAAQRAEDLLASFEEAFTDVRRLVNRHAEAVAVHDLSLQELEEALRSMKATVDELENWLGLSEDQLSALARRMREEMAQQLNLTLVREEMLERELRELRQEFDSYRRQSEQELARLRHARYTGPIAIILAVLAVLSTR